MRPIRLTALLGAAAAAAACVSSPGGGEVAVSETRGASSCIFNSGIRDFTTLDERNLILYGPGRRGYHVTLSTPSQNLEYEFMIRLYDRDDDNRICPYGMDLVLIDGPFMEQIPIREIVELDDEGVEALLVEYGLEEAADEAVTVTGVE